MISIAPVRKQVIVKATQQRAFDLFTHEMSRWWPATHSILKSPLKQYVIEPQAGGRWYAIGICSAWETGARRYAPWWMRREDGPQCWSRSNNVRMQRERDHD